MFKDFVKETSVTTGVGSFVLLGPQTTYRSFSQAFTEGATVHYSARHSSLAEFETGSGVMTTTAGITSITRAVVLSSSNSDNLVNFSAGTKIVACTPIASVLNTQVGANLSDTNPTASGPAAPGVSLLASRGDHVHPSPAQADVTGLTTADTPIFNGLHLTGPAELLFAAQPGWNDLTSDIHIKGTGANDPSWVNFRNNLWAYAFSATVMKECWASFHLGHDYALGTKVYPHIHWSPNTTSTGTVRWGFEYSVAKGHQQGVGSTFGATTTVYVDQTIGSNSQYRHFVAEVSEADAVPSTLLEPDTLILIRVFREAAHANDTFPDAVFGWTADCHYQCNTFATKNRLPNFYS